MDWRREWRWLILAAGAFAACYWLPVERLQGWERLGSALWESLHLVRDYAREHVLLCLVPAFFIAGAISVFLSKASVMRYLGGGANKVLAYGVASVSGAVLAVCSCTVLPLFAGIHQMGAGLGPACAFLYSGPAINVLSIILTARVLGMEMGIARAAGAILFSVVLGLLMHWFFRREEAERERMQAATPVPDEGRPLYKTALHFAAMVGILVFANWPRPASTAGLAHGIWSFRWGLTLLCLAGLLAMTFLWFERREVRAWVDATWGFARQILPLLLAGVLVAGALLGRPGHEGLLPSAWVSRAVGGDSVGAIFLASLVGALMYFATLTEVPILQGLIGNGMGKGPALALLLAGPALSLPNMLVIRSILGTRKTLVFCGLVVLMATLSGVLYAAVAG